MRNSIAWPGPAIGALTVPVFSVSFVIIAVLLMTAAGCDSSPRVPSSSLGDDASKWASAVAPTSTGGVASMVFVPISGGQVTLGSSQDEPGHEPLLEKIRVVSLRPFEISATEVTVAQYFSVVEPSRLVSSSEANLPITKITWREASRFCELLGRARGGAYRLPTELEFEHACRANSRAMISPWIGNSTLEESIRSYRMEDPGKLLRGIKASCNVDSGKLKPVKSFAANSFGVFDMHGNAAEWCDVDGTLSPAPTPRHAPIRGGSAISTNPLDARAAKRAWQPMETPAASIGFRVVRELRD